MFPYYVDGLLVWDAGTLAPEQSAQITVILSYAQTYALLGKRMADLISLEDGVPAKDRTAQSDTVTGDETHMWIANGKTDFALDAQGRFFWEDGKRQGLTCSHGGNHFFLSFRCQSSNRSNCFFGSIRNVDGSNTSRKIKIGYKRGAGYSVFFSTWIDFFRNRADGKQSF